MNYARNIKTKKTVFFSEGLPLTMRASDLSGWAFWDIPRDRGVAEFEGHLIGEDPGVYCTRLRHRPGTCPGCKEKALTRV